MKGTDQLRERRVHRSCATGKPCVYFQWGRWWLIGGKGVYDRPSYHAQYWVDDRNRREGRK